MGDQRVTLLNIAAAPVWTANGYEPTTRRERVAGPPRHPSLCKEYRSATLRVLSHV